MSLSQKPNGRVPRLIREVLIPLGGLVGIFLEAVRDGQPRIYLLVVYIAMLGLPPLLPADTIATAIEKMSRRNGNGSGNDNGGAPGSGGSSPSPPLHFARFRPAYHWRYQP